MHVETTRKLIKRLITHIQANTTECSDEQMVIASNEFFDEAIHQQEKTQFFLQTPQVICFAAEVKTSGSFYTTESLGVPLLITRNEQGELGAFINACAHRGAKVAQGSGESNRLICQFHGWTYHLDGTLRGRPKQDCFENAGPECNLTRLPVSDKYGLIVVGLSHQVSQEAVDAHLDSIGGEIDNFSFATMTPLETRRIESHANWKIIAGLSHESYHFSTLHKDSVAQYLKANAIYDTFETHSRWAFGLRGLEQLLEKPESQWPGFLPGAINHTLFPGTLVITNPEDAQMIRVEPGNAAGQSIIHFSGVCRNADKKDASLEAFEFGFSVFTDEDLPAAEQCQQGFEAGQPTMIIGKNEPVMAFWHKLWAKLR